MYLLFHKATKLHVDHVNNRSLVSLHFLSALIDLSHLVEIKLKGNCFRECDVNTLNHIATFMWQAHNLSSVLIYHSWCEYVPVLSIDDICFIISRHVKHVQVAVNNSDEAKMMLEKCNHLSSVQFNFKYSRFSNEIVQWLEENTINSTYRSGYRSFTVWLGRKKVQSNEFSVDLKRIKLTEGHPNNWLVRFLRYSSN